MPVSFMCFTVSLPAPQTPITNILLITKNLNLVLLFNYYLFQFLSRFLLAIKLVIVFSIIRQKNNIISESPILILF